jgi:hypothetical protein
MVNNLEDELEIEFANMKEKLSEQYRTPTDTEIKKRIIINFPTKIPASNHYRMGIEENEDKLDIPIRDYYRERYSALGLNFNEDGSSEKYLSTTHRKFFQDIDQSLVEAGVSEEIMNNLYELKKTKVQLGKEYKYNYKPDPMDLLSKSIDQQIAILYDAYKILRKKGYDKSDITA